MRGVLDVEQNPKAGLRIGNENHFCGPAHPADDDIFLAAIDHDGFWHDEYAAAEAHDSSGGSKRIDGPLNVVDELAVTVDPIADRHRAAAGAIAAGGWPV